MATIKEFRSWVERDLDQWGGMSAHVEILELGNDQTFRFRIYTFTNRYQIKARENAGGQTQKKGWGYLGCVASTRKPRAGEDWLRGNDLPDGPLAEDTWRKILAAIVSYELVHVTQPPELTVDTPLTE